MDQAELSTSIYPPLSPSAASEARDDCGGYLILRGQGMNPYRKHNDLYNKRVKQTREEWHLNQKKDNAYAYQVIGFALVLLAVFIAAIFFGR